MAASGLNGVRVWFRTWRRRPGATLVVVGALAIALAANIVAFSLVRSLLLRPYPFRDLGRLVLLRETRAGDQTRFTRLAPADVADFRRDGLPFEELSAYRYAELTVTGDGDAERVRSAVVSTNLFRMLGATAAFGRALDEADASVDAVAVLSDGLWRRRFGGRPDAIGRDIVLDGRVHRIVGIMPATFNFPRGSELWLPLVPRPVEERERVLASWSVVARLAGDVGIEATQAALARFSRSLAARYPETHRGRELTALSLREELYEYTLPLFSTLQLAALFVLLVAAVNASTVYASQRLARRAELGMHLALGATRARLLGCGVAEALGLTAAAAAVAVPLAWWTVGVVRQAMPRDIAVFVAGWDAIRFDASVAGFGTALVLLSGLGVGLASGWALPRSPLAVLPQTRWLSTTTPRWLRRATVGFQLVAALGLLSASASVVLGFRDLADAYRAFRPDTVLMARVSLPDSRYSTASSQSAFFDELLTRVATIGEVERVAVVSNPPASNVPSPRTSFEIERRPAAAPADMPSADIQTVGGAFFSLLDVRIVDGRPLREDDDPVAAPVVVISREMASRFWPGENPIGQRIRIGGWQEDGPWWRIVGIAADVRQNWFDPRPPAAIYVSAFQRPQRTLSLLARTRSNPAGIAGALRRELGRLDPAMAGARLLTLRQEVDSSLAPIRLIGMLLTVCALMTLVLAAVGVYGTQASAVAAQTREVGIRIAVGATPARVLGQVVRESLGIGVWGAALGVPVAMAVGQVLGARVFGLLTLRPAALVGLSSLLVLVALLSTLAPARRAASTDPVVALRGE